MAVTACDECRMLSCVCAVERAHQRGCPFRVAAAKPVGVQCHHGRDVCPECDPCPCPGVEPRYSPLDLVDGGRRLELTPVVFLDMDGVVNSAQWFRARKLHPESAAYRNAEMPLRLCWSIDPGCVRRLNEIVRETGARVVLSSTWRTFPCAPGCVEEALRHLGFEGRIASTTPVLKKPGSVVERGDEIDAWLNDNHPDRRPPFVVLDDECDMTAVMPWLVQTDFVGGGLGDEHVARAIAVLRGERLSEAP